MVSNPKQVNLSDLGDTIKAIIIANKSKVLRGKNHKETFTKDTHTTAYVTLRKHSDGQIAVTKQFKCSSGIPVEDKHWLVEVA